MTCAGSCPEAVSGADGSSAAQSDTSGKILPRYWTTWRPAACSILDLGNSSKRATSDSGTASRSEPQQGLPFALVFAGNRGFGARRLANFRDHARALGNPQYV